MCSTSRFGLKEAETNFLLFFFFFFLPFLPYQFKLKIKGNIYLRDV